MNIEAQAFHSIRVCSVNYKEYLTLFKLMVANMNDQLEKAGFSGADITQEKPDEVQVRYLGRDILIKLVAYQASDNSLGASVYGFELSPHAAMPIILDKFDVNPWGHCEFDDKPSGQVSLVEYAPFIATRFIKMVLQPEHTARLMSGSFK